jgi:hypothetical protein
MPAGAEASDTGIYSFIRGDRRHAPTRQVAPPYTTIISPVSRYAPSRQDHFGLPSAIRSGEFGAGVTSDKKSKAKKTGAKKKAEPTTELTSIAQSGRRHICVRTCDGYFFPLDQSGSGISQEGLCKAACPGASVRLYTVPNGASDIDSAVNSDGKTYASLPMAFAFQQRRVASCTCNSSADKAPFSVLRDPTLRTGDVVMMDRQAMVFKGGASLPYRRADFAEFTNRKANITAELRRDIDRSVGASHFQRSLLPFKFAKPQKPARRETLRADRRAEAPVAPPPQSPPTRKIVRVIGDPVASTGQ